jgi:Ca2+-binding EF-hand superfamily protein
MDLPTFITISNIFKIYANYDQFNMGVLNYKDFTSAVLFTPNYALLQNFTNIFIYNDWLYESTNKGTRISNLLYVDSKNIMNRNYQYIHKNSKFSVDKLYLIFKYIQTLHVNKIYFSYSLDTNKFSNILTQPFFKNFTETIDSGFSDFQKVSSSAGKSYSKTDYYNYIFNILDLNNSTYVEVYELLLAEKASRIFNSLQNGMKLINDKNNTQPIKDLLNNFNDNNILLIDNEDINHLIYVKYFY